MGSISNEEIDHATELFAGLGGITTRKMMGGLCLYHDGTIFAMVHSDKGLMLKGEGAFRDELEAAGCERWTYQRKNSDTMSSMPYWSMPEGAQDDPDLAVDWARRALAHL